MLRVNVVPGAGKSTPIRYFTFEDSSLEFSGAFRVRADDSDEVVDANEEVIPPAVFDLAYGLVDEEDGPALSVIISEQAGTVCFAVCHRDQPGWTLELIEEVKERIAAAFS